MHQRTVRAATDRNREAIARIWHQGWHDAHDDLVPSSILVYRTLEHFRLWLGDNIEDAAVAEVDECEVGFYMLERHWLSKLYVDGEARGSGIAQTLLVYAETALAASGVVTAGLLCTVGNDRALRFYERHGWRWKRISDEPLWCPDPAVDTPMVSHHHYTKTLS